MDLHQPRRRLEGAKEFDCEGRVFTHTGHPIDKLRLPLNAAYSHGYVDASRSSGVTLVIAIPILSDADRALASD